MPRGQEPEPVFPAPAAGQARAGEELPTGPRVTSATGRISTRPSSLAREGWAEGVLLPLRCLAGNPASGERKGLREGGGADGKEKQRGGPSLGPFGQMLTQLRAPGVVPEVLPPFASCRVHRDGGDGAEGRAAEQNGKGLLSLLHRPRVGDSPPGPWVWWVGCCLREAVLSKWEPGLGNHWLKACVAPGKETLLLRHGAPATAKDGAKMERAGRPRAGAGLRRQLTAAVPSLPLCSAPFEVTTLYSQGPLVCKCCKKPTNSAIFFPLLLSTQLSGRFPAERGLGTGLRPVGQVWAPHLHSRPHPHIREESLGPHRMGGIEAAQEPIRLLVT